MLKYLHSKVFRNNNRCRRRRFASVHDGVTDAKESGAQTFNNFHSSKQNQKLQQAVEKGEGEESESASTDVSDECAPSLHVKQLTEEFSQDSDGRSDEKCALCTLIPGDLYSAERDLYDEGKAKTRHDWQLTTEQEESTLHEDFAVSHLFHIHFRKFQETKNDSDFAHSWKIVKNFDEVPRTANDTHRSSALWVKEIMRGLPELDRALRANAIRLVKSTWIIDFAVDTLTSDSLSKAIPPCQELPEDAFFSYNELLESWSGVLALSYMWLSNDHPDPFGETLNLFAKYLTTMMPIEVKSMTRRQLPLPIFWDYVSLYQKPRTESQEKLFQQGLQALGSLFSFYRTQVIVIKEFPPRLRGSNQRNYENRGWCFTEMCWANLTAEHYRQPVCLTFYGNGFSTQGIHTRAPIAPDVFAQRLQECTFTNDKTDRSCVTCLYADHLKRFYKHTTFLNLTESFWNDTQVAAIMEIVAQGYMPNLRSLSLENNRDISHVGWFCVAEALILQQQEHSFAHKPFSSFNDELQQLTKLTEARWWLLNEVNLRGCRLYTKDLVVLSPALSRVKRLDLCNCGISVEGCRILIDQLILIHQNISLLSGQRVDLSHNSFCDAGLSEIIRVFYYSFFCGLKYLALSGCGITDDGIDRLLLPKLYETHPFHAGVRLTLDISDKKEILTSNRGNEFAMFSPQVNVNFRQWQDDADYKCIG